MGFITEIEKTSSNVMEMKFLNSSANLNKIQRKEADKTQFNLLILPTLNYSRIANPHATC